MGFLHPGPIAFLPSSSDRPQSKPRLSRMDDPELPGFNSTRGLVPHSRFHTPARNAREHTNCPAHASFQGPFKPLRCSLLSAHSTLLGSFCAVSSGREAFTEPRDFLTGAPEFLFAFFAFGSSTSLFCILHLPTSLHTSPPGHSRHGLGHYCTAAPRLPSALMYMRVHLPPYTRTARSQLCSTMPSLLGRVMAISVPMDLIPSATAFSCAQLVPRQI